MTATQRARTWPAVTAALLALAGCGTPVSGPPDAGHWWDEGTLATCAKQGGAMPTTVAEAVTRLNALPDQRGVACFLASLPRPLSLVATRSVQSAQPAESTRSPRVFIVTPSLILSVVPDGAGAALLEFGEPVDDKDTIKGELEFPLDGGLSPTAPFERLDYNGGLTRCGLCHRNERPYAPISGATVSAAFRPDDTLAVSIEALARELDTCDPNVERARCEILAGLFGFGEARQGVFPKTFDRFIP